MTSISFFFSFHLICFSISHSTTHVGFKTFNIYISFLMLFKVLKLIWVACGILLALRLHWIIWCLWYILHMHFNIFHVPFSFVTKRGRKILRMICLAIIHFDFPSVLWVSLWISRFRLTYFCDLLGLDWVLGGSYNHIRVVMGLIIEWPKGKFVKFFIGLFHIQNNHLCILWHWVDLYIKFRLKIA